METNKGLRWAEERVVAFALGALDDEDESRFRGILADRDEYADLLAPGDVEDPGHVPAALIARWASAGRELRGIERELVLDHVHRCDSCRADLALLGLSPDSWSIQTDELARRRQRVWLPWAGGALLGAAAVLALVMALPRAQSPLIHGVELAVVTPGTLRGADPSLLRIAADATAFILATALPSDIEAGSRPLLVVIDPDGRRLSETGLAEAPWSPPATQIVLMGDPGLAAGDYRVELEVPGEPAPRILGTFRVEHSR